MEHALCFASFALTGFSILFSRSASRVQIKNRFPTTISILRNQCDGPRCATSVLLSSFRKKRCPKGSASRADKAAILRSSECTRLSQRVLSASVWVERAIYRGKSFQRLLWRYGRRHSLLSLLKPRRDADWLYTFVPFVCVSRYSATIYPLTFRFPRGDMISPA